MAIYLFLWVQMDYLLESLFTRRMSKMWTLCLSIRGEKRMNCWHCKTELIWGGDDDCDVESYNVGIAADGGEDIDLMHEQYSMVTNLTCPNCNSLHLVYYPVERTMQ